MVIGEGFVDHQEHDAGEESEGQADEDGDLEGNNAESHPASALPPSAQHTGSLRILSRWATWRVRKSRGSLGPKHWFRLALSLTCGVTWSKAPVLFGPQVPPSARYFLKLLLGSMCDFPPHLLFLFLFFTFPGKCVCELQCRAGSRGRRVCVEGIVNPPVTSDASAFRHHHCP